MFWVIQMEITIFAHHYYLINYIATGFLKYYLQLFLLIIIIII